MIQSETTKEIFTALSKCQSEIRKATKDAVNPHFKSRYADLESVWEAIREPIATHGLAVVQDVERVDGGLGITTQITHVSGEWIRLGPLFIPLEKSTAHSAGSAITYGKRYGLAAAFGVVAGDDDDGNSATSHAVTSHHSTNGQHHAPTRDEPTTEQRKAKAAMYVGTTVAAFASAPDGDTLKNLWDGSEKARVEMERLGFNDLIEELVKAKDQRKAAFAAAPPGVADKPRPKIPF